MPVIIDGYNLIFAMGWEGKSVSGKSLEKARRRLVSTLSQRLGEAERGGTTIVFDADRLPIRETSADFVVEGIRVLFAVDEPDADTLIEQLIRQHSTPKKLTVVSSDHRLHRAARRRKAKPIDSDIWIDRLLANPPNEACPQQPQTESNPKQSLIQDLEATDWAKEFGTDRTETDANSGNEPGGNPDSFNPFPPGYGEDLLEP